MVKKKTNETSLDMIARNLAALHSDVTSFRSEVTTFRSEVKEEFKQLDKRVSKIETKLDSVAFSHSRRLDLLEDDMVVIKNVLTKNNLLKK